jgi:hypothetical protein
MKFLNTYPQVLSFHFSQTFFANKALEYYTRMGEALTANKIRNKKQKVDLLLLDIVNTKKVVCNHNSFKNKIILNNLYANGLLNFRLTIIQNKIAILATPNQYNKMKTTKQKLVFFKIL